MFLPSVGLGRGERGAGGGLGASSQPPGPRPYGASISPALYCTPCCFNQWQACSQDTENRGYCAVSGLFSACLFLSYVLKLLHLTLQVLSCLLTSAQCAFFSVYIIGIYLYIYSTVLHFYNFSLHCKYEPKSMALMLF